MLNLGLVLQRPYESKYNAYRRFLISNGKKNLSDIRDELRIKFEPLYARFFALNSKISTFQLFQLLDYHTRYGLLELETRDIVEHIPYDIRNCPECAHSCFHSDLYQFPWLDICPIHGQPLTYSCPSCKELWPRLGYMKTRKCKTCGSSYIWDELVEAKGFHHIDSNSRKLEFLDNLIHDYKALTLGTIINLQVHDRLLDKHSSVDFNHESFPSVMSTLNPSLTSTFEEYGIKLHTFNCLTYAAQIKPVTPYINTDFQYYDVHLNDERAKENRKELENVIKKEIKSQFNIDDLTFPGGFYFGETRYIDDIAYLPILAFNIWKSLVDGDGLICSIVFKKYEPLVPCLLKTLIFDEKCLFEIQYRRKLHVEYNAPIEMQAIVYKYDLWQTFTYILKYLDAIRFLNNKKDRSWHGLASVLDDVLNPKYLNTELYAFFLIDGKSIVFLYSELCDNFSLKDFVALK